MILYFLIAILILILLQKSINHASGKGLLTIAQPFLKRTQYGNDCIFIERWMFEELSEMFLFVPDYAGAPKSQHISV